MRLRCPCSLAEISEDLGRWQESLTYLDASHNKLNTLPEALATLRSLGSLLANNNTLTVRDPLRSTLATVNSPRLVHSCVCSINCL